MSILSLYFPKGYRHCLVEPSILVFVWPLELLGFERAVFWFRRPRWNQLATVTTRLILLFTQTLVYFG